MSNAKTTTTRKLGPLSQEDINEEKFKRSYLLNSQFVEKNIDLIIWDFDNTLIDTKAYLIHSMEPDFIRGMTDEQLTYDIPYWQFFYNTVFDLIKKGKNVGIASFGMYKIVRAYMDRIFGYNQKIFTVVNTYARCKIDEPLQPNKNGYILNIMEHYRIMSPERVILFDDLASNISAAISIGIVAILVKGVKYTGDKRDCSGLFGPKTIITLEDQLRSVLNANDPLSVCQLGHVGDRKVGIATHGRKDRCPMKIKSYLYPDRLYLQNLGSEKKPPGHIENNILDDPSVNTHQDKTPTKTDYNEPQFRTTTTKEITDIAEKDGKCDTCKTSTPFIVITIILLIIILALIIYGVYNNLFAVNNLIF